MKNKEKECISLGRIYQNELNEFINTHIFLKNNIMSIVEKILLSLSSDERNIIYYEFMEPKETDWWKGYFEDKYFYSTKSKAIDAFLRCLYN